MMIGNKEGNMLENDKESCPEPRMTVLAKRWHSYPDEIKKLNPNWELIEAIATQELRKAFVGDTKNGEEIIIPCNPPANKNRKSAQVKLEVEASVGPM